ncbi:protein DBF4 homolog B [Dendrobates tinctorius]|uniref:protein DBF4 homolog B n=1 Tax=Dendrobates tinctorius TaxID=92724 RepID=UPI003CC980A5
MSVRSPVPCGQHVERALTLDRRKRISFTGKSFYLDLPHNKHTQLLTKAICSLGGVIESFLSRDINYVVTGNRKTAHVANVESCDGKGGSSQHPTTEKIEKTPYSRGKQLLKKVVQSQECSSILSSARSWGVCILHVDEVLEYLECSTERRAKRPVEGKGPAGAKQTLKVGKLKSPFLKIEDRSRKYRPIHRSFSNFPECSFISSDRGPFETALTNHSTHKDRDVGEQDKDAGERPQNWEKSGYCECCHITYRKLCEHLISKQHCFFALNASNYTVIDDITSHIVCEFVPLPLGFKPSEDKAPPQSLEEQPPLTEEEGLGQELKNRASTDQPMDQNVQLLIEELSLVSPEKQFVKQDAECPLQAKEALSKDPLVENMVVDSVQEHLGDVPENVFLEDHRPQCTVSTMNAEVQCELHLLDTTGAETTAPMGLVTEVSWYMEEAGVSSLYTVQSVVIPSAQVLDKLPELTTKNVLLQPPLCLDDLGDPVHALAQGGFNQSSNEPVQEDPIITACIDQQLHNVTPSETNVLLTDAPQDTPSAAAFIAPFPAPPTERECTLHLDTAGQCPVADVSSGTEVPLVEAATDQHQHVLLVSTQDKLLVNAPCELQSEPSNNFSIDQFTLAPWHPAADGNVTVMPGTETLDGAQNPELLVPNTGCCGGKRKHCWSPCHPPAKRLPLHCLPMWSFHQLPSSVQQPTIPVFSDCVDIDRKNRLAEVGEGSPTTLCFDPKLAQYEASSESDWDFQLVSQHHNNPQQSAHLGDLTTAQVNLDESWYGKRLGSVLTHEQALGSPSTTQTVTVSHASYDLYLSGVAS